MRSITKRTSKFLSHCVTTILCLATSLAQQQISTVGYVIVLSPFLNVSDLPLTRPVPNVHSTSAPSHTDLKSIVTTLINSNGDGRSLSNIRHNLAVLKEKMRGPKGEICKCYKTREKGKVIIEQAKGNMSIEENNVDTRVKIGARLMAFQEVHMSTCDKSIVLHSEYQSLQSEYCDLADEYLALNKCT